MTAIIKRLLALATAFTLALSLVGCGVGSMLQAFR